MSPVQTLKHANVLLASVCDNSSRGPTSVPRAIGMMSAYETHAVLIHSPDDPPVGGQYSLCKRGTVVRAERARSVDLVAETREKNFALTLEGDLFPGGFR